MKGYPRENISKRDYDNLLNMPEHASRAKSDLSKLAALDDSKCSIELGSVELSNIKQIDNPLPEWKRKGFKDKSEVSVLYNKAVL